MDNEKTDDVQCVVTCTHCGMQTGLSLKQLEGDKPLKCPACGAPFEIVAPPKAPRKAKRDYGRLIDDPIWGAYWRDRRAENGGGEWDAETTTAFITEIDKVNEDDVILATCTYCGTQTRVNTSVAEADKPVPCRVCGAPLEIESSDPWEKRVRERSKLVKCEKCGALTEMRNTYYVDGMRYCARCNELLPKGRLTWGKLALVALLILFTIIFFTFIVWEACTR